MKWSKKWSQLHLTLFAGKGNVPIKLTARRTIPLVEDECVLGTNAVVPIGGLTY